MENELIYVLISLISALGLLLTVFVFLYLRSQNSLKSLSANLDLLKKEKDDLENEKLEPVNTQAKIILDSANKKASEIISTISGISEDEKKILNDSLKRLFQENLKIYREAASRFSKSYEEFTISTEKDIKARLDLGINKIIADTQNEIRSSTGTINNTINGLYKGYETEVAEYKKQILSQIDKLGADIIKQVSLKVLGKNLSNKEQEDLVIKSLEEAKKLGFFD